MGVLSIFLAIGKAMRKPVWLDGGIQTAVSRDKEGKTAKMGRAVVPVVVSVKLRRR